MDTVQRLMALADEYRYATTSTIERRAALEAALRELLGEPVGTAYRGSATRDGFRVVWSKEHAFEDGITPLYALRHNAEMTATSAVDYPVIGLTTGVK